MIGRLGVLLLVLGGTVAGMAHVLAPLAHLGGVL